MTGLNRVNMCLQGMRAHWKEEASQAGGGGGQLVAQFDEIYFTIQILTKKYFTAMYQAGKGAIGATTRDRQGFACTCSSYKLSFADKVGILLKSWGTCGLS